MILKIYVYNFLFVQGTRVRNVTNLRLKVGNFNQKLSIDLMKRVNIKTRPKSGLDFHPPPLPIPLLVSYSSTRLKSVNFVKIHYFPLRNLLLRIFQKVKNTFSLVFLGFKLRLFFSLRK